MPSGPLPPQECWRLLCSRHANSRPAPAAATAWSLKPSGSLLAGKDERDTCTAISLQLIRSQWLLQHFECWPIDKEAHSSTYIHRLIYISWWSGLETMPDASSAFAVQVQLAHTRLLSAALSPAGLPAARQPGGRRHWFPHRLLGTIRCPATDTGCPAGLLASLGPPSLLGVVRLVRSSQPADRTDDASSRLGRGSAAAMVRR
jgi:hypothetical protein